MTVRAASAHGSTITVEGCSAAAAAAAAAAAILPPSRKRDTHAPPLYLPHSLTTTSISVFSTSSSIFLSLEPED